jgi:hypothetical protein
MSSLLVFNRVYRLEIQSVMLVFSTRLVQPPPPPSVWISRYGVYTVCIRVGGSGCVESIYRVIHYVFDQIPNLQNCFTTPNKNLGEEGDR